VEQLERPRKLSLEKGSFRGLGILMLAHCPKLGRGLRFSEGKIVPSERGSPQEAEPKPSKQGIPAPEATDSHIKSSCIRMRALATEFPLLE
jgi:hypothetical protein